MTACVSVWPVAVFLQLCRQLFLMCMSYVSNVYFSFFL